MPLAARAGKGGAAVEASGYACRNGRELSRVDREQGRGCGAGVGIVRFGFREAVSELQNVRCLLVGYPPPRSTGIIHLAEIARENPWAQSLRGKILSHKHLALVLICERSRT